MSQIVYSVAMSLDGFIAANDGSYDWILMDPDIDFAEIMGRFDTMLIGRKSFEMTQGQSGPSMTGMKSIVFSSSLDPGQYPDTRIEREVSRANMAELRQQAEKDIWLFGGGELFRSMVAIGQVDVISVAVIPVLLGCGLPLLPPPTDRLTLKLIENRTLPKTGTVCLEYEVIK